MQTTCCGNEILRSNIFKVPRRTFYPANAIIWKQSNIIFHNLYEPIKLFSTRRKKTLRKISAKVKDFKEFFYVIYSNNLSTYDASKSSKYRSLVFFKKYALSHISI